MRKMQNYTILFSCMPDGPLAYSPRGVQCFVDVERTGDESIRVESSSATGPLDFRAADRTTIKSARLSAQAASGHIVFVSTKRDGSLGGGGVVVFVVVVGGRNRL